MRIRSQSTRVLRPPQAQTILRSRELQDCQVRQVDGNRALRDLPSVEQLERQVRQLDDSRALRNLHRQHQVHHRRAERDLNILSPPPILWVRTPQPGIQLSHQDIQMERLEEILSHPICPSRETPEPKGSAVTGIPSNRCRWFGSSH
jgi:hypothetical protein